ncbi:MAG: hypothetical protein JXR19_03535 [Bacteroidia bacterium]
MKYYRYFSYAVCCLVATAVSAQEQKEWADSILNHYDEHYVDDYHQHKLICDSIVSIYEENGEVCNWIQAIVLRSDCEAGLGLYDGAVVALMDAQSKVIEGGCSPVYSVRINRSFARIYQELGEFEKADSFVNEGLSQWSNLLGDSLLLARLYFSKGTLQPNIELAMRYYDSALLISKGKHQHHFTQLIYNNIGYAYAESGNFDSAYVYFNRALKWIRKLHSNSQLSMVYNNLAGTSSSATESLKFIDSAVYYASLSGVLRDIEQYTWNRSYAHYLLGNFKEGYHDLDRAYILKDSLLNIEKLKAISEFEQKYEAAEKAKEIERLNVNQLRLELNELTLKRNQIFLIAGLLLLILSAVILAIRFVHIRKIRNQLASKNVELDEERKLSDELLLNILPSEVAMELKTKGKSEARLYNNVTVLFTDFVSFTKIGEQMSPEDLVQELNKHFTAFDAITEKYGLEKIKTIGDAYLAVCGLPDQHEDHAIRTIKAAKEMIAFTQSPDSKFKVRVGVNSGPVVAGIVGVKKYAYDIWGDTVNTAARLEQNSVQGEINASHETYDLIKEHYTCEHRGKISAKNKGDIDMYFVKELRS